MLVTASQEAGVLEEDEEQMLHRVFGFADLTAGQIMTPRTETRRRRRRHAARRGRSADRDAAASTRLPGLSRRPRRRRRLPVRDGSRPRARRARRADRRRRPRARGADRAGDARSRRSAGRDAATARPRSHRHRRVRRHGGPRHLRIADGAHRRRNRRRVRRVGAHRRPRGRVGRHRRPDARRRRERAVRAAHRRNGLHHASAATSSGGWAAARAWAIPSRSKAGGCASSELDGLRVARVWLSTAPVARRIECVPCRKTALDRASDGTRSPRSRPLTITPISRPRRATRTRRPASSGRTMGVAVVADAGLRRARSALPDGSATASPCSRTPGTTWPTPRRWASAGTRSGSPTSHPITG